MYWYVLVCTNLWTNEVSNHEMKRQHEHFHTITSHLGMFLAINVYVMKVGYSVDMVIIEVSATNVVNLSDNRFQTASRRAAVTRGFPLLLIRSSRRKTWV